MSRHFFSVRRSIYGKLVAGYFAVILLSFVFMAVLLSTWFERYYYNEKEKAILSESPVLNSMMEKYRDGTITKDEMTGNLSALDKMLDTRIWIIDRYTLVISSSNPDENIFFWVTNDEINNVLKGGTIAKEGVFEDKFKTPMLTVAFPLENSYDQIVGAAIMNSPIYGIKNALKRVYSVIWFSSLFAIAVSTIIVYFLSQRIVVKPIYEINRTAKALSNGDLDRRVKNISSKDEIGELAESFNAMADALQNNENKRRDFVANISHELRSPITSIRGFIQGILDGTIPGDKRRYYLEIVLQESKRLTRLISDVLDLSKLESGESSLNIGPFDINELIRLNIIRFESQIEEKEIDIFVTLSGDELFVLGDRDGIGQVISNLVDNAIKFTSKGGRIEVGTSIENKKVVITVKDNGTGIPEDELKLIWDRFHMVDKSRTTKKGTGLGLSIVRQIINQHNENIWVESKEGEGSKFSFTLPLYENI